MADVIKREETEEAEAPVPARRGGAIEFVQQVRREMKKVTWPSWKETYLTTIMVFIMVGITMVFFLVVDTALAYGERFLIGS